MKFSERIPMKKKNSVIAAALSGCSGLEQLYNNEY
jgi:hypothetical protein